MAEEQTEFEKFKAEIREKITFLKNEIDDLVEAMDKFHRKGRGELPELRERFDLLLMKLMSLLQDDAPELADEIARSREDLWNVIADPVEFARLST